MKVLGIDSSGMVASVALVEDDILVGEYSVNHKKTHSQTLLPMLDELMKMTERNLEEIDAIAVAAGPGSFTGLRIGSATVKGLGLALDKPVVSVPTCHALAYNLWRAKGIVCPIMDARRNQVYCGIYRFEQENLVVVSEQEATDIDALVKKLNEIGEPVVFTGDGIPVYRDRIRELLQTEYYFAPAHQNRQRAGAVAALGARLYQKGYYETADQHVPVYLRKSQAEREREEKEARAKHGD